jgi:predicted O-linked N-acetylglucosamine transferase (SPINDLY family)
LTSRTITPDLRTALLLHQGGQIDKAADIYRQILARNPADPIALHYFGLLEARAGKFESANSLMARSLALEPFNVQFRENYATTLCEARRFESAVQICDDGLKSNPANVYLLYISATALLKLQRLPDSLQRFDKLLAVQPDHLVAINERGSVFAEMREYDKALVAFQRAAEINPRFAEAHLNIGNVLGALNRSEEAKSSFKKALALNPKLAHAWSGLGNILCKHNLFDEALAAFDKALALEPGLAEACLGRGNVYIRLKQYSNASTAYDEALSSKPDLVQAWLGRGNAHSQLKQYDKALIAYDRALSLEPNLKYAASNRLHVKQQLCDWTNFEAEIGHVLSAIRDQKSCFPGILPSISSAPQDQLQCAKAFVADRNIFPPLWRGEVYSHDRIRIAYLSADFHEHATAYLTSGLFEKHDSSRFQIYAISLGPNQNSDARLRIAGAVEHFIDVQNRSDEQIAAVIRQLEIDILVDLKGFTDNARRDVLARRVAPLQVNYLGYPGTMGADYVDYIIADPTIIPEDQFPFYSERVVWLPDSYQVNDSQRPISEHGPTRDECGLPKTAFVFCCFNSAYKILPSIFEIWMRLLRTNEDSILWLFEEHPTTSANLCREAEKRGVSADRLVFATKMALSDHLARYRYADLFLDTLPCNAHTTASDALWAGVPVLTCLGTTFAGRVAASLLQAIGLPELVTISLKEYEALALKLADDPAFLLATKAKLARHREVYPLFDTARFTRHIEAAYLTMWERYQRGERPEAFTVAAIG